MVLSSETVTQVIEWSEMIKRLCQLYHESKSAIDAIGGRSNGKSLFDNATEAHLSAHYKGGDKPSTIKALT